MVSFIKSVTFDCIDPLRLGRASRVRCPVLGTRRLQGSPRPPSDLRCRQRSRDV